MSDRALYNPTVINPRDVNAPVPAPKIPVNVNSLNTGPISNHYFPIPFDAGNGNCNAGWHADSRIWKRAFWS